MIKCTHNAVFLKLLFFLIPLFITECHGGQSKATQDQHKTTAAGKKEKLKDIPLSHCGKAIVNNEFSDDVLAFKVFKADTDKIKSLFLNPVNLKLVKEKDIEGNPYYHYIFADGVNKFILYNNNGFYLEAGEIKNDKVRLNKQLYIGMAKDQLLKLIKATNIKCDTVVVNNDESSFEIVYIFNKSKLKQIEMGDIVE